MARITILNLSEKILDVSDHSKTLLKHFQDHGLDWMQACGGKGRCTTCSIVISEGDANFEPPTAAEKKYMAGGALGKRGRLACQARITGDVTLIVPRENQLPHLQYSDE